VKILWLKADFLHPTMRGGQIRTLEMLKRLHRRHEVHYIGFDDGTSAEAVPRASEYAARAYAVPHRAPLRGSAAFWKQAVGNLSSPLPLSLARYEDAAFGRVVREVRLRESPDVLVCDFLTPAVNLDDLAPWVLFQHNVETMIWRRHAEHAAGSLQKRYFRSQAERMFRVEARVCRGVKRVIAVSQNDAATHKRLFGLTDVPSVPTGVDTAWLAPPATVTRETDLVFIGSMDWMPNIDGVNYFLDEILPLIRRTKPDCSVAIVGRRPPSGFARRAASDPQLRVTGTVEDVRPYLWGSAVSIVPLRIGGGTRLKIYESMAARVPVVATSIAAEGLETHAPEDIRIADTPGAFADACLELLGDTGARARVAQAAWELVSANYSWDRVVADFEWILDRGAG
jgi:glycosyltransferase involved in cell wall biosynthesis